jgi:hypothetical protein
MKGKLGQHNMKPQNSGVRSQEPEFRSENGWSLLSSSPFLRPRTPFDVVQKLLGQT